MALLLAALALGVAGLLEESLGLFGCHFTLLVLACLGLILLLIVLRIPVLRLALLLLLVLLVLVLLLLFLVLLLRLGGRGRLAGWL